MPDTDGTAVGSLDLSVERDRLEREQRKLSHASNTGRTITRSNDGASRSITLICGGNAATSSQTLGVLRAGVRSRGGRRSEREGDDGIAVEQPQHRVCRVANVPLVARIQVQARGTHFVAVNPRGTTKECASCGVSTEKPLWVRGHSCPACGFEADRDANAAWNILSGGLEDIGVGHSESPSSESRSDSDVRTRALLSSTPVETALPVDTPVSAKHVVETGSPTLEERTTSAVSE